MSYRAWFQCINDQCKTQYPLNSIIYRCTVCGSLLEVQHDMQALAHRSATAWMKLFEDRYKSNEWPYGSGVWGKKEWVLPQLANENVVSLYEGGTNLFWAERFGKILGLQDLWIKLCGNTHSGSFKDLEVIFLLAELRLLGGVTYRLLLQWRGHKEPPMVLQQDYRSIPPGQPLNYAAGPMYHLGAKAAGLLGIPIVDQAHVSNPCPVPIAR